MKPRSLSIVLAIVLVMSVGCRARITPTQAATFEPTPLSSEPTWPPPSPAVAVSATPAPTQTPTPRPSATATPGATWAPTATQPALDPAALISRESLLAFVEDLSSIRPDQGWRNSAGPGEREALDYVAGKLGGLNHLQSLGLELERQSFRVFLGTEPRRAELTLQVGDQGFAVPASGLRGDRDSIAQALRFDSDGRLGDGDANPVLIDKPVVFARSADAVRQLGADKVKDRIAFLDYAAIDYTLRGTSAAAETVSTLLSKGPAAIVLVTQFSTKAGASHGVYVGEGGALSWPQARPAPPAVYVRLEDMAPAGVASWDDLGRIASARLTWDADVSSPATSGNLVARIPGADPSRAVILGAHIDSPNSPGALDDGSGSAVLLEVARVIDAAGIRPPIDLYLVWFGCEEIGLYGSYNFAASHQELLDRAVAMLQIDMLGRPLDGVHAELELEAASYARAGTSVLPWPEYLTGLAAQQGIRLKPTERNDILSDNSALTGFDVPNANLVYMDEEAMAGAGGLWNATYIHNPYDTVEMARDVADVFEQMAQVALLAGLHAADAPDLRFAPPPERRAVFVASHTEVVHMGPTTFSDLGMALALEGFDVDMIPYGKLVTPEDLKDASLVVVLPVIDYPCTEADVSQYDEAWTPAEVAALEQYAANGGMLVLTNSARRLKYLNLAYEANEDWTDANALAERLGVTYTAGAVSGYQARAEGDSPLVQGVSTLALAENNSVPFTMPGGRVLAQAGGKWVAAIKDYGQGGIVLTLGDVGMLASPGGNPVNLRFWQNLARYARER